MAGARSPRGRSGSKGSRSGGAPHRGSTRRYDRTLRVNEVLREVIADELERIGDERLGLLTITGISVDPDFGHATVWLSALTLHGGVESVAEALGEHRVQLQAAVARQVRLKRTPLLQFRSDPAITSGQRIEEILRDMPRSEFDPYPDPDDGAGNDADADPAESDSGADS